MPVILGAMSRSTEWNRISSKALSVSPLLGTAFHHQYNEQFIFLSTCIIDMTSRSTSCYNEPFILLSTYSIDVTFRSTSWKDRLHRALYRGLGVQSPVCCCGGVEILEPSLVRLYNGFMNLRLKEQHWTQRKILREQSQQPESHSSESTQEEHLDSFLACCPRRHIRHHSCSVLQHTSYVIILRMYVIDLKSKAIILKVCIIIRRTCVIMLQSCTIMLQSCVIILKRDVLILETDVIIRDDYIFLTKYDINLQSYVTNLKTDVIFAKQMSSSAKQTSSF